MYIAIIYTYVYVNFIQCILKSSLYVDLVHCRQRDVLLSSEVDVDAINVKCKVAQELQV